MITDSLPVIRTDKLPGPKSTECINKRNEYVAIGVSNLTQVCIKEAKGALIEDVDGNVFVDFASGIGIQNLGHCDDDVVKTIKERCDKYIFVAGADISQMKEMNGEEAQEFSKLGNQIFRELEIIEKPVIAAVNGYALGGGCELSLCCDIRIASENAVFGQPEVTLGIIPGFGGTQRLSRIVGIAKAKELIFTANNIKAEEAMKIGLINHVVPKEELMNFAMEMAKRISKNAPLALKYAKVAMLNGSDKPIEQAIFDESFQFKKCFETKDQKLAMTAFVEKSKFEGFKNI